MFATDGESNYDKVSKDLLAIFHETGAGRNAFFLGGGVDGDAASIPLFGQLCRIEGDGVYREGGKLDAVGSILILRYVLTGGNAPLAGVWTPYRDLKDGAQFAAYIKAHIADKVAATFSGKAGLLGERLEALGGRSYDGDMRADVAMVVHPLPRVPVLCLFWDRDAEFEAGFRFLFDGSAPAYLDLEALAVALQYIYVKAVES